MLCTSVSPASSSRINKMVFANKTSPAFLASIIVFLAANVAQAVPRVLDASDTITSSATATTTSNGVTTPSPTQTGMVSNCGKFYFVESGETCDNVAAENGITVAELEAWNPAIGSGCTNLWANYYACVGLIDTATTTVTPTTTPTTTNNGITTPTPTQTGMVSNCDEFYFVKSGDTCYSIAMAYGIAIADFIGWNPAAGAGCTNLYASTYACVGVL